MRFLSSGNNDKKLENNLENVVSNLGKVKIVRCSRPQPLVVATKLDDDQSLTLPKPSERCSLIPKGCEVKVSVANGLLQNDPAYLKMVRNFNDAFLKKYDLEILLGNKSGFRTILSVPSRRLYEEYKDTDQGVKTAGKPHDRRLKHQSPREKRAHKTALKSDHVGERITADESTDSNRDSKVIDSHSHVEFENRLTSLDHEDVTSQDYMVMPTEEYLDMTGRTYVDMTSPVHVPMSPQNDECDKINEYLSAPEVPLSSAPHSNSDHDVNSNENTALKSGIQTYAETKKLKSQDESAVPCPNSPSFAWLPADLSGLSVPGVSRLLSSLHMQFYANKFQEEQIDGKMLMTLDEAKLCSLDISPFHVAKLMKFIGGWRPNVSCKE